VFIPTGSDALHAFTRPLNLKHPARPIWRSLMAAPPQPEQILSDTYVDLVSPDGLRPAQKQTSASSKTAEAFSSLRLIVFPRYRPDGEFSLTALSRAQAAKLLLEGLVNARNLPDHGLSEVARLARLVPAYQMNYSDFAQIGSQLEVLCTV